MQKIPEFSIITVTFNSQETLEDTLKSVLSQTYTDYEYIIIDGSSNDNTDQIIATYKDRFGDKLIHVSEPDKGIYDAMNKGIRQASGNVIGILNSDDYYYPQTLATVHAAFQDFGDNYIVTGAVKLKSDHKEQLLITNKERFETKIKQYKMGVRHPATFIPRKVYSEIGLFDLNYKIAADAEFIYRVHLAGYKFHFLSDALVVMRDGGISNARAVHQQLIEEKRFFLAKYCKNKMRRNYLLVEMYIKFAMVKNLFPRITSIYRWFDNKLFSNDD